MSSFPGGLTRNDGTGSGFGENVYPPLNVIMKHTPYLFGWLGVTHKTTPGVERMMDGVLLGDESNYKSGAMVMSKKDGLGLGLFFWGARNEYDDIRPVVPYLADEELASKTAVVVRKYISQWEKMCSVA